MGKNDDDGFEEIVNGFEKSSGDEPKEPPSSAWDAVAQHWGEIPDTGGILLRGFIILEYVDEDGDRSLHFSSSPDTVAWDALGMMERAKIEITTDVYVTRVFDGLDEDED